MAMSSTFYHRLVFLFGCFCLLLACSDADTGGDRGGNSDADTGGDSDANRGGDSDANRGGDSDANTAVLTHDRCSGPAQKCNAGTLLPVWQPQENLPTGDRIGRAIIYFLCLCYLFLGVSIISDRFMASIEVITSQEREVTVKKPGGEVFTVTVRIWNDTVSNLTLMALGSSAPEILLSIIEVCSQNFIAGELGPNTIVGSAAFNLFMIIAICVYVIPSDQIRRQNHLRVFFVTASWSIFAYIWLYLILAVISRGVIEVWEGVLTFMFFPITVLTAYIADRKILPHRFLAKRYRTNKKGVLVASEGADVELRAVDGLGPDGYRPVPQDEMDSELRSFEEHRREFMEIFKELRKKHPNAELDALQQMAEYEMLNRGPKSRAFYRVQATRKLIGGGNVIKKKIEKEHHKSLETIAKSDSLQEKFTTRISFDPGHYTVLENVGSFNVTVSREGGSEETTILVDYRSEDGTATAESDYLPVQGTLTFRPGERHQVIKVQVIDDDVFEEDEHFYIHLENLRVKTKDGLVIDPSKLGGVPIAELTTPSTATVMILDDDHAGVFSFGDAAYEVVESAGHVHVTLFRHSGARGKVIIPYKTVNGSAVGGKDFEKKDSELIFDDDETQKTITIGIVDDEEYEKTEDFYIDLGEPIWAKKLSDQNKLIERYLKRQRRKQEKQAERSAMRFLDEKIGAALIGAVIRKSLFAKASGQPLDQLDKDKDSLVSGSIDKDTEEDKIAELGRPRLGDIKRCRIRIKESKEFKSVVDRMIKTANVSLVLGTSSWREQFIEAVTVSAGDDDDNPGEDGELTEDKPEKLPSCGDYVMHFICVPWKILFAFVPPTDYWGGWLCFVASIAMIGLLTAVIGDLASHFGCSIGLKDSVTAISFVALGTSVPDTFASKVAAVQDKYADSSIGNVTGSNAVNVFLGIGIAWSIAAIYHWFAGTPGGFKVDPGTLAFSVTIFCVEALVCIAVMLLRRIPAVGGELGGPNKYKIPTVLLFCGLWMLYLLLSSLESYCIIKGF